VSRRSGASYFKVTFHFKVKRSRHTLSFACFCNSIRFSGLYYVHVFLLVVLNFNVGNNNNNHHHHHHGDKSVSFGLCASDSHSAYGAIKMCFACLLDWLIEHFFHIVTICWHSLTRKARKSSYGIRLDTVRVLYLSGVNELQALLQRVKQSIIVSYSTQRK